MCPGTGRCPPSPCRPAARSASTGEMTTHLPRDFLGLEGRVLVDRSDSGSGPGTARLGETWDSLGPSAFPTASGICCFPAPFLCFPPEAPGDTSPQSGGDGARAASVYTAHAFLRASVSPPRVAVVDSAETSVPHLFPASFQFLSSHTLDPGDPVTLGGAVLCFTGSSGASLGSSHCPPFLTPKMSSDIDCQGPNYRLAADTATPRITSVKPTPGAQHSHHFHSGWHPSPPRPGPGTDRPAGLPVADCPPWGLPSPPPHPAWTAAPDLVGRGQARPGLVGPPVVVLSFCHFHIVAEPDQNLPVPQLVHRGSLIQLKSEKAREPPAAMPVLSSPRTDSTCLQGHGKVRNWDIQPSRLRGPAGRPGLRPRR